MQVKHCNSVYLSMDKFQKLTVIVEYSLQVQV